MEIRFASPVLARDPGQAQKNRIRVSVPLTSTSLRCSNSFYLDFFFFGFLSLLCAVWLLRKDREMEGVEDFVMERMKLVELFGYS